MAEEFDSDRFRIMAEHATDILMWLDHDATIRWVSPSVEHLLGLKPEELIGTKATDLFNPDDLSTSAAAKAKIQRGEPVNGKVRLRRADGSYRWARAASRPVWEDGELVGRVVCWTDAQAEIEAEQQRRESAQEFRLLAENAADMVVRVDSQNRRTWVSDSVRDVLGMSPQDYLAADEKDLVHPDDLPGVRRLRADYENEHSDELVSNAVRMRHADGHWLWVSGRSRRLPDDSRISAVRVVDEEVAQRRALELSNKDLEAFAAAVSHDLRAPIRHMTSFLELFVQTLDEGALSEEQQEYLQYVLDANKRMRLMIEDLLRYSRLDRERVTNANTSVQTAAAEVQRDLTRDLDEAGAQLNIVGDAEVAMSRPQLVQLLRNLIQNSIVYRNHDHTPIIDVTTTDTTDDQIVITVEDNGVGIDPIYHETVFRMFTQINGTSEGTGVGLAIVKRLVDSVGGTIGIESDGHNGTRFVLTLPRAR